MTKIVVLPLNLLVHTNPMASVSAFQRLGVSYISMLWNWRATNQIIEQYKQGQIDNAQFIEKLSTLYPPLKNREEQDIWDAWNAMCRVSDMSVASFKELEKLNEQNIDVYILSHTNPAHVSYIEEKLGEKIPGIPLYSYQHDSKNLLNTFFSEIKKAHPDIQPTDIQYGYREPKEGPYAQLKKVPLLRWILSPLGMWFHQGAVKHVNNLKKQAGDLGYTLLPLGEPSNTFLSPALKKLSWINENEENFDHLLVADKGPIINLAKRDELKSDPISQTAEVAIINDPKKNNKPM